MKTKMKIIAVCLLSVVSITSCDKYRDDVLVDETMSQKLAQENSEYQVMSTSSTLYYSMPSPGSSGYTGDSQSSIVLPGITGCNAFYGGILRARVSAQSSGIFTVVITKQDNSTFGIGGIAYLKVGSVCGEVGGSKAYSVGASQIVVNINAASLPSGPLTQGAINVYPVVISNSGGTRYYAEPFTIYTNPSYHSGPYYDGLLIAKVNKVNVFASDWDLQSGSSDNQCTKFCNDYYRDVYGMNIIQAGTTQGGHANTWYNNYYPKGLVRFSNQVLEPMRPRVGDILCMSGGPIPPGQTQGYGHVGIVIEVTDTYVRLANQNGGTGTFKPVGWQINRLMSSPGYKLSNPTNYVVLGWMRKPS